ncbi:MAG: HAMP domain-containing protein [Rubrivivax sp.]|nr:HAMP domain-containing protein [Rubrivivax sp.]
MPPAEDAPLPVWKSLRARGALATLGLLVYLLVAGLYVASERNVIRESVQGLEELGRHEKALALTESAVSGAILDVNELAGSPGAAASGPNELRLYMETCAKLFTDLETFDPAYALLQRTIGRSYASLVAAPVRAHWIDLREALKRAADELEIRRARLAEQRETLNTRYQRKYDAVTVETLALAGFGLAAFGTLTAWFFTRLARDIRRLEQHARLVVRGQRGAALPVQREDELGHLMRAVNRMSAELDERDRELLLEGERRSHHDKMLAVGALAAGVAHEVNNPLAVISGVAQAIRADPAAATPDRLTEGADLILAQTQRAAQAARQLAEAATPQPAERDWVDLNALVQHTLRLIAIDRRYRGIELHFTPDATLPALRSSAGALQHVLMLLLGLAADGLVARGNAGSGTAPTMQISAGIEADGVSVQMLFPPALDFDRGEVQRTVMLARATVEPLRGRLAFGQAEGPRQRIKLSLPADDGGGES